MFSNEIIKINGKDLAYFLRLDRFPDKIAFVDRFLYQTCTVPLHHPHVQH